MIPSKTKKNNTSETFAIHNDNKHIVKTTQFQLKFIPFFLQINPLHTVPTYRDDKVTLTDSHSILIYLCEKHAEKSAGLWPADPIERINVLNKLFYSGTVLFRRDSDAIVSVASVCWHVIYLDLCL